MLTQIALDNILSTRRELEAANQRNHDHHRSMRRMRLLLLSSSSVNLALLTWFYPATIWVVILFGLALITISGIILFAIIVDTDSLLLRGYPAGDSPEMQPDLD